MPTAKSSRVQSHEPVASPKTKRHFGSLKNLHRLPNQKNKSKPPKPPAKPQKSESSDDLLSTNALAVTGRGPASMGKGVGFNFKNDPKFGMKLQERRQEIYGGAEKSRPRSWGHDQEQYEEVAFTASDDDILSNEASLSPRVSARINSNGTDEEYVDCEPHEECEDPQQYLDFEASFEELHKKVGKGPNTLKREEFLLRPPLPLPSHTSAGNPINSHKVPVGGRAIVGANLTRPAVVSAGSEVPPPVPRRGNERQPMSLPEETEEDVAPPVPRRHPHASDRHRAFAKSETNTSTGRGPPPDNAIPLPPRSRSPSTSSPSSPNDDAPPLPQRGPRQPEKFAADYLQSRQTSYPQTTGKTRGPPPIPIRQRSLSPDDLVSSPPSAGSEHIFEEVAFGVGSLPLANTSLSQVGGPGNRAKMKPPLPYKSQVSTGARSKVESYETQLPPDIGMKKPHSAKICSYEVNLPPSIGNRATLTRPETSSSAGTRPTKPPVATKPALTKSSPHVPAKPPVSKKPKPLTIAPKPSAATSQGTGRVTRSQGAGRVTGNPVVNQLAANFNKGPASISNSQRTFNSENVNSRHNVSQPVRTRNGGAKPPLPPGKPKPLLPPTVDRSRPLPAPNMY